jgi:hypothetical protein
MAKDDRPDLLTALRRALDIVEKAEQTQETAIAEIQRLSAERDQVRAVNAALLAALEEALPHIMVPKVHERLSTAIAYAKEEKPSGMEVTPLEKAAAIVGNANKLAKAINRKQSTVWGWMKRGWPSPDACRAIEEATGGKVRAAELLEPTMGKR